MKIVLQRVIRASVSVEGECCGSCGKGFCLLVGIEKNDTREDVSYLAQKVVNLRIFSDENGKINKSIGDINGSALIVSQFTLSADCSTGRRPSFTNAGTPERAKELFDLFVSSVQEYGIPVQTGIFGAEMLVQIENDGPATFILESQEHEK